MARRPYPRPQSPARLRWLLALLFLGLAIPAALLVRQGFVRLEVEEFRRQQLIAESVVRRIDTSLQAAIASENARPVSDFEFASPAAPGDAVQLSPLSSLAPAGTFPGTIGYFQVDAAGQLSTPLLPDSTGERSRFELDQFETKVAVERRVAEVLEANRLVDSPGAVPADTERERPANAGFGERQAPSTIRGQGAFDELADAPAARRAALFSDTEMPRAIEPAATTLESAAREAVSVASFVGDIEPLRFSMLETGHFVLFRNAWRDGQRYVQGLIVDRAALFRESFVEPLAAAGLPAGTRLRTRVAGATVAVHTAAATSDGSDGGTSDGSGDATSDGSGDGAAAGVSDAARDDVLYTARLSPPLSEVELEFAAGRLDRGPGFSLLVWTAVALGAVLVGGVFTMYFFGMQQLKLAREQRNFVSAVSHELKTPLTSIRMYGEMLKSGWADESRKQVYYDYIVDEGERLSRLIDNVLQLSRLNNGGPTVEPAPTTVGELFDLLRSRLATQAERAGFALELDVPPDIRGALIAVDTDALTQVFINLVDNAIKFSGEAGKRQIAIAARRQDPGRILLTVRDFGPGIPVHALKRLFEPFYRPDNELTRATSGTGIGLALVHQLVTAMDGRIDVRNCEPGAEFRLVFPACKAGARFIQ